MRSSSGPGDSKPNEEVRTRPSHRLELSDTGEQPTARRPPAFLRNPMVHNTLCAMGVQHVARRAGVSDTGTGAPTSTRQQD